MKVVVNPDLLFGTLTVRSLRHEHYFTVLCCAGHHCRLCGVDSVCHQQQGRRFIDALMGLRCVVRLALCPSDLADSNPAGSEEIAAGAEALIDLAPLRYRG
jgi:hypothetical protein